MPKTLVERFFAKVNVNGSTPVHRPELGPCHIWTGAADKDGYGRFRVSAVEGAARAPRVAYVLAFGPIPEGLEVLHHCDNPPCVRPEHLWAGTHLENHQDKATKGRAPVPWVLLHPEDAVRGEQHPGAKLTEEAIADIRQNYVPRKTPLVFFAKKYDVAIATVHLVVSGETWREAS